MAASSQPGVKEIDSLSVLNGRDARSGWCGRLTLQLSMRRYHVSGPRFGERTGAVLCQS